MSGFTVVETIKAPIEKVFAAMTDFGGHPERIEGIDAVEVLTDGPSGLGTRFRETRTLMGKKATEEMEVTVWEPPHQFDLFAESHGSRYNTLHRLTEEEGVTRVTMTFEATPVTFFAKVMSVLTKPLIKSMVKICMKDLRDVKAAVEKAV